MKKHTKWRTALSALLLAFAFAITALTAVVCAGADGSEHPEAASDISVAYLSEPTMLGAGISPSDVAALPTDAQAPNGLPALTAESGTTSNGDEALASSPTPTAESGTTSNGNEALAGSPTPTAESGTTSNGDATQNGIADNGADMENGTAAPSDNQNGSTTPSSDQNGNQNGTTTPSDNRSHDSNENESVNANPVNVFEQIYDWAAMYMGDIFSALAFIISLVIALIYKRGLIPGISRVGAAIKGSVDTAIEESERLSRDSATAHGEASSKLDLMRGELLELSSEVTLMKGQLDLTCVIEERKRLSSVLAMEIELLYSVFMTSSLPQYMKEELELRFNNIRKEFLKNEESTSTSV